MIPIRWNEGSAHLTIGARTGSYSGMVKQRTFRIVLVRSGHGIGGEVTSGADKETTYEGEEIQVNLR